MTTASGKPPSARSAAIYARLSVAADESVSIDRQVESARRYAEERGWPVAFVAIDDGVSATKKRPEDRIGWQRVLSAPESFDVVIVWKVDRLARSVLDFLTAARTLEERGAGVVAVADPVDLSTAQGRAFAQVLAVFAELEASAISARVTAARRHLLRSGRVAGGERAWPFGLAPNPDGPGYVLAPIPERADAIRQAATDLIAGRESVAGIARRWTSAGLLPKSKRRNGRPGRESWAPSSVAHLLRNPTLYGATLDRGEPLRNPDGSLVIGGHAILDRPTWLALQRALDSGKRGRRSPSPALLSGLARCGSCDSTLVAHRPSTRPETAYKYVCPNRDCPGKVAVSMPRLDEYVARQFLRSRARFRPVEAYVVSTGADPGAIALIEADLADVEDRLAITDDDEEAAALVRRRKQLRDDLASTRDIGETVVRYRPMSGGTYAQRWKAGDVEDRRDLLSHAYDAVRVRRGKPGRHGLDESRVELVPHVRTEAEIQARREIEQLPADLEQDIDESDL